MGRAVVKQSVIYVLHDLVNFVQQGDIYVCAYVYFARYAASPARGVSLKFY